MVTILMPCYNAADFLGQAVASLQAQSCPDWELLVVDDGSQDGSPDRLRELLPQARLMESAHVGIGAALNQARPLVGGDWVAFLDADDLWAPDKLAVQLAALDQHPDWDGVFVGVETFYEVSDRGRVADSASGRHRGALLLRRAAYDRMPLFREDLKVGEFVDWMARGEELGLHFGFIDLPLYRRRIHSHNTSRLSAQSASDYLKVVKAALDRRRLGGS